MKTELDEYCPCCGYATLSKKERLVYFICTICFWEDDPIQFNEPYYQGGANGVSLVEARMNYQKTGSCDGKKANSLMREPRENELRKNYEKPHLNNGEPLPFWLMLLQEYLSNPLKSGLTLPFLFGAENEMRLDEIPFKIFLLSLISYKFESILTIQKCVRIGEYVIGIAEWEDYPDLKNVHLIQELIIHDSSWEEIEIEEWIIEMNEKYNEPIQKKDFSKNNGKWGKFDEFDKELMKRTNSNAL